MAARAAHAAGFAPEVEYAEPGVMVVGFIDGADLDAKPTCAPSRSGSRAAARLPPRDAAPMSRGRASSSGCSMSSATMPARLKPAAAAMSPDLPRYLDARRQLEAAQTPLPIVFGHNDLLPANFLDDGKRLWLIDFEYAGFTTAMFDLAGAASNSGMDDARPPDAAGRLFRQGARRRRCIRAFDAMQCASLLREAMWAWSRNCTSTRPAPTTPPMRAKTSTRLDAALDRLSLTDYGKTCIMTLPAQAQIVVIGGGIIGCSTAYHLARDHKADVVLLEQGKLTSGSTWHAAGLVGQLRSSASITQVLKYSVDLYKRLEAETGLATGWKMTGCLRLATNQDRWTEYKRLATTARSFGMEMHLLSPAEVKAMWPLMETSRPGRRKLAADRRAGEPLRHHPVAGQGRAHAWREDHRGRARHRLRDGRRPHHAGQDRPGRRSPATRSSTAPGNGRGRSARWPASTCRCSRSSTSTSSPRRSTASPPDAPTIRDPDRRTYFKEEVGGLVMGGYEPNPHRLDHRRRARTTGSSGCSTTTGTISSSTWSRPSPASRRWQRPASSR